MSTQEGPVPVPGRSARVRARAKLNALRGALSRHALLALCVLGAVLRVVTCFYDEPLHPDEFFQYLEPAYIHLTGVGLEAWEFRDGLRSWVLPFYNGAWIAAFMQVGVQKGSTLVRLVQVQWALVNASLVWLAYRGAASAARRLKGSPSSPAESQAAWAGWEGGALAAFLCASFPLLVIYAGHTLSELPSMLFLVAGLVEIAELTEIPEKSTPQALRKAALGGFLLSLGACLRIANGPLVLMGPLWLLVTRRYRALGALALAALLPALGFALVDLFTWGSFAHSFIAYLKFNLIEGKAANFGTAPASYYLEFMLKRAPFSGPLLLIVALLGLRGNFAFLISALLGVLYLSTQPHKEERFILVVWPLLFIAAGATLGAFWSRLRAREGKGAFSLLQRALPFVLVLATAIEGAVYVRQELTWLGFERFRAERVIARDPTLTGLMVDAAIYGGGALWLGVRAPHFDFDKAALHNPLITHVLVETNSKDSRQAKESGFEPLRHMEGVSIMRRLPDRR